MEPTAWTLMLLLKPRELFLWVLEAGALLQTSLVQPRHQGNLSFAKVCRQVLRSVHVMALAQNPSGPAPAQECRTPLLRLRFGPLLSGYRI